MTPEKLNPLWCIADYILSPGMRLISTALREKPQETHRWHVRRLPHALLSEIDVRLTVAVRGTESSRFTRGFGAGFHIPLIGGWRNYIVIDTQDTKETWYIGWIVKIVDTDKVVKFGTHALPLITPVRMLTGSPDKYTTFFAHDKSGKQMPLQENGVGIIGDNSYGKVRLF